MSQVQALLNPAVFQPGWKAEPLNLDMNGSQKNYLLVPLKLDQEAVQVGEDYGSSGLTYEINLDTVLSFTERNSGQQTLNKLIEDGKDINLETDVFFSRFDAQLCF